MMDSMLTVHRLYPAPPVQAARDNRADAAAPAAPGLVDSLRSMLVDEIECGLIVCSHRRQLHFANRAAQRELAAARVLRSSGEMLQGVGERATELDAAVRQAVFKGRRELVRLGQGDDRLLVSVLPLQPADSSETCALLVLGRRRPCSDLGLEMLANAYKLTLAERRVLAGLLQENAPREIAKGLGVALSTVRTQISSIRDKLDARSIDGVLIRTAEMPPIASALRLAGGGGVGRAGGQRDCVLPAAA